MPEREYRVADVRQNSLDRNAYVFEVKLDKGYPLFFLDAITDLVKAALTILPHEPATMSDLLERLLDEAREVNDNGVGSADVAIAIEDAQQSREERLEELENEEDEYGEEEEDGD